MNPLRILIAPVGFKENIGADEVADAIEIGVLKALPNAIVTKSPLVDGGEGFTKALIAATEGTLHQMTVTGPLGNSKVDAFIGFLGGTHEKVAVLEMAAAAGLHHVPLDHRDPLLTTTYGVGELIFHALETGAQHIIVGCGDSGTMDAGAGMAQALGVGLLDRDDNPIGLGAQGLMDLQTIDLTDRDPRLEGVTIEVALNWKNMLCGEKGVANIFGPQKGAPPKMVSDLDATLTSFAEKVEDQLNIPVRSIPGGGASGGLGAGLHAFLNAQLYPHHDIVMRYLNFDNLLPETDLVITAEGMIDYQTTMGKIPSIVAQKAQAYNIPVIVIAGSIGQGAEINLQNGIVAFASIQDRPLSLSESMAQAPELLARRAESVLRMIAVGRRLKK